MKSYWEKRERKQHSSFIRNLNNRGLEKRVIFIRKLERGSRPTHKIERLFVRWMIADLMD
jgi:hypothetical protein